jgi:hypothetical protein
MGKWNFMSRLLKLIEKGKRLLPPARKFSRLLLPQFLGLILVISCAITSNSIGEDNAQARPPGTRPASGQIIIKFRTNDLNPSRAEFVDQLSRDADARLIYQRPMSGGAHVFGLKNISDADKIKEIIRRLAKRPDVLYVEQDIMMRHQKQQE